ncbi:MAG TPA: glycosyltransferase [Miltoncostaeaceae bacterium]|nr:glycosyltransferase [Miltoncostaeaceae bacterium]
MRIDMVSEHASPLAALGGEDAGGQNVHVAALALALARRGAEVVVHTRRDDPSLPDRVEIADGVTVAHVEAGPPTALPKDSLLPHMPEFAGRLSAEWCAAPPDVVHSHFWMSGLAALWAARPLGVPVVHTFHALGIVKRRHQGAADTSPPDRLDLERRIVSEADRIVATCSDEVFELMRMGADRHRVSVVPCGVDVTRFTAEGPAEPRGTRPRVVALSRLVPRKGVDDVIRAMRLVPAAELLVVGGPAPEAVADDPECRRLMDVAREAGVADRVVFRGALPREAVPALLRSADLVACTPWYEPFGIVPLEAMACGVPVVATRVGGLVDSVVHEVTGVHVPPREPEALGRALADLLATPERRAAMGRAGARRARERFGWDRVAGATLEAYGRAIEAARPARALSARGTAL